MRNFNMVGMFRALMKGKSQHGHAWLPKRRERHIHSQMRFFSGPKYKAAGDEAMWRMVRWRK